MNKEELKRDINKTIDDMSSKIDEKKALIQQAATEIARARIRVI